MIQISSIKICKENFKPYGDIIDYDKEKSFKLIKEQQKDLILWQL